MLRIMSYNIRNGGEDRLPQLTALIQAQAPDVVAVLEANDRARVATLADRLQMTMQFGEANSPYHIAWLSKLPIVRVTNHRQPVFRKTLLELEITWGDQPLHLFAVHLVAGRDAAGERQRLREIAGVVATLATVPRERLLLMGDFNAVHPRDVVAIPADAAPAVQQKAQLIATTPRLVVPALEAVGLIDGFRRQHPTEPGFTYTTTTPIARFDYLFAAPTLIERVKRCAVITGEAAVAASDHFPLVAELT